MTAGTIITLFFLAPTDVNEFWGFMAGMITIFFFAGLGNAGTFKQMPMLFPKRQAGGVVGFTSGGGGVRTVHRRDVVCRPSPRSRSS